MARRAVEELAKLMRSIFRQQATQARAGKERYGDWDSRLAAQMLPKLSELYLSALKGAGRIVSIRGPVTFAQTLANAAKSRAILTAARINDTTSEWLQSGRELASVFSADRAVEIALTEESQARNQGLALATLKAGGKLRWKTRGKNACEACRSLNGTVIHAGKQFIAKSGVAVEHPPLHPSCYCRLEVVK